MAMILPLENSYEMGGWQWFLEIIADENFICSVFNISMNEAWGVQNGHDWENGCKSMIRVWVQIHSNIIRVNLNEAIF